jgi:hypothetical protein
LRVEGLGFRVQGEGIRVETWALPLAWGPTHPGPPRVSPAESGDVVHFDPKEILIRC